MTSLDTDDPTSGASNDEQNRLFDRVGLWIRQDVDEDDRAELQSLLDQATSSRGALAELRDRFAGSLQFGTAGLRGAMAAGPNRMNRAVVTTAAAGLGSYLLEALGPGSTPRVVVGFDARHRSRTFALDTAAVLTAAGAEVHLLPSALPTPVLAFAVRHLDAEAGVMVTASHNPAADNGYKVYLGGRVVTDSGQGAQIVPPYDALIAERIAAAGPASAVPRAESGWEVLGPDIVDAYLASVRTVGRSGDGGPRDLRIVTTSLHGVGGRVLAGALADAGFTDVLPVEEQLDPDPDFPSVAFPNPEETGATDMAVALASEARADLVIANDPDADRCAVAVYDATVGTHQGAETARSHGWRMLHGDEVGALLGREIMSRVAVAPGGSASVASSVVSSRLLSAIAARHGFKHTTTLTGFKWIARTPELVFGYEEALGYCVDPAHVRDKDGISAAVLVAQLAARLKGEGRTLLDALDDIARENGLYLTDQVSARFEGGSDWQQQMAKVMASLRSSPPFSLGGAGVLRVLDLAAGVDGLPPTDGIVLLAADDTRVVVRPSGTEPKVKCYLEVVEPVDRDASSLDVGEARVAAHAKLERVKADMRAALGL